MLKHHSLGVAWHSQDLHPVRVALRWNDRSDVKLLAVSPENIEAKANNFGSYAFEGSDPNRGDVC
jgi:hypothetical protein